MTQLNPYISFNGNARQAMEFYQNVFGGKLDVSTFADYNMAQNPADANKIMHAQLTGSNGITFMAADTTEGMPYQPGNSITMSLSGSNEAELRGYWTKLSESGTITLPLEHAPWGDTFGMLTDRFGVDWMFNISGQQS